MCQIENIIAAVGEFPQDESVLLRAAEIAREHRARLTIIHVIDTLTSFDFVSVDLIRIQNQMRRDARESVEAAVAKLVTGIREIDIRIENGLPSKRVIEIATEINADLMVMRANQSSAIREKIIGSTTDRVIRASRVPVLVVKRTFAQAYQSIVVSIDTSDDSAAVVPFVATLCPMAGLSLIHVVQIPQQLEAAMMRAGSGKSIVIHRDALINKAKDLLSTISKTLDHRPIKSSTRVVDGDPAKTLVRATWNPKVDLIVLAPDSKGMIRRALLGSVAQRVLRDAACDILIYRSTA